MGTRFNEAHLQEAVEDHPHAYGDKLKSEVFLFKISGSSPRVWGQEFPMTEYEEEDRIIPTRMGTRGKNAYKCYDLWDHPHAYGDKKKINTVANQIEGSSPRVWGQVVFMFVFLLYVMDHPHAYGDKLTAAPQPDRV